MTAVFTAIEKSQSGKGERECWDEVGGGRDRRRSELQSFGEGRPRLRVEEMGGGWEGQPGSSLFHRRRF